MSMTRRTFLAATGWAVAPMFLPRRAFGANDKIQVGFIGVGRRAQDLVREVGKLADMQGVAAADLNTERLIKFKKKGWKVYTDYRRKGDILLFARTAAPRSIREPAKSGGPCGLDKPRLVRVAA